MEKSAIQCPREMSEEPVDERIAAIRAELETLDTRLLAEHRAVQALMRDLMALWDALVLLEKQNRSVLRPSQLMKYENQYSHRVIK